jgi:hypothetical protein
MKFELLPRPTKGEDGKPLLYARPAKRFKYTQRTVDEYCNKYRCTQVGEISHLFGCFLDACATLMRDGSRVETEIGSFAPKLKIDGDYTDPDKVQHKNVRFGGIVFIPSKRFEQELEKKIIYGFLKTKEVVERHPAENEAALEEALQKSLKRGYATVRRFSYYSGLRYDTAKRFLNRLCEGENARLRKLKEGSTLHFFPFQNQRRNSSGQARPPLSVCTYARSPVCPRLSPSLSYRNSVFVWHFLPVS